LEEGIRITPKSGVNNKLSHAFVRPHPTVKAAKKDAEIVRNPFSD
jgi:hypothetical protein